VKELVAWVESGDYDRIISGSYVRRGDEPPVSEEFDAAVSHYRERFTMMIERTAGGINKLVGQIRSWLFGQQEQDGTASDEDDAPG
jgi:hypothetical protein